MDKNKLIEIIKKARNTKRNFEQKFDLIINLKNLNLKKPEENINTFLVLPYPIGKKIRVCALVGDELASKAKECCDKVIHKDEFSKYNDKKLIKKLAREYDYFVAQGDLMVEIAKVFGKVLGPRGKMPNPKTGCIVGQSANLKSLIEKLNRTISLRTKNELVIKTIVGSERMSDEEIAENILFVYNQLLHLLPQEKNNIRNIFIKLTMGKPVEVKDV